MPSDGSPRTLYVASGNTGKLRDFHTAAEIFRQAANGHSFRLEPLPGLASIPVPDEDAPTFAGNARAKATYYSAHLPGSIVIADDSGLEVDALGGAPGVYSARYAQRAGAASQPCESTDHCNNRHLLEELAHALTPQGLYAHLDHRTAQYRCVLAAARNGSIIDTGEGRVEGWILLAPQGTGGFGYDPLFYLPELKQTMAELDPMTRLALSHRGHALRALLVRLAALG